MSRGKLAEASQKARSAGACIAQATILDTNGGWDTKAELLKDLSRSWDEVWCAIGYMRDAYEALGMTAPGDNE